MVGIANWFTNFSN